MPTELVQVCPPDYVTHSRKCRPRTLKCSAKPSVLTNPTEMLPLQEQDDAFVSPLSLIAAERRSKVRYPLVLNVRYRILGRRLQLGVGQAVNLSSGGALVRSRHELVVGKELEIQIEWPSHLDGCIPLQLVAIASVVRCGPSSFAVRFHRHQFRTQRSQSRPIATSVFRTPTGRFAPK
jgi:hypothetical protein